MQITEIVAVLVRRVTSRLVRRALAGLLCLVFALSAVYQLTVAAVLTLEEKVGVVQTRLIVGAVYLLIAAGFAVALWATRAKLEADRRAGLANSSRDLQIAMIVESILLGLALARGTGTRKPPPPPPDDPPRA